MHTFVESLNVYHCNSFLSNIFLQTLCRSYKFEFSEKANCGEGLLAA
jgi:hypothetical protein